MFAAVYSIAVGSLMIGWWAFSFTKGRVPETRTEPVRLAFHLAAEALTAVLLVVGGFGLLFSSSWASAVYLVGSGMLLYSVIVSPGYFAQRGEWPLVGVFVVLLLLALLSLALLP
ncbi:MAG: hypothetical protein M3317_13025 [Actinomycetota bacterium]|nr:hypothetical protein [Actinomycetota bacterium]